MEGIKMYLKRLSDALRGHRTVRNQRRRQRKANDKKYRELMKTEGRMANNHQKMLRLYNVLAAAERQQKIERRRKSK